MMTFMNNAGQLPALNSTGGVSKLLPILSETKLI